MQSEIHTIFNVTFALQQLLKKSIFFGHNMVVYIVNLRIFVCYIGIFGFQNCQKSVKSGPVYFNEKWSAEKCPLNWSCPLFLESAKLEFHCTIYLQVLRQSHVISVWLHPSESTIVTNSILGHEWPLNSGILTLSNFLCFSKEKIAPPAKIINTTY